MKNKISFIRMKNSIVFILLAASLLIACSPVAPDPSVAQNSLDSGSVPRTPSAPAADEPPPSGTPAMQVPADETTALLYRMGLGRFPGDPPFLDFEAADLDGKKVKISDFKGKVVMLNFWATWCPPCKKEMPSMETLYQTLKHEKDFIMLAVDLMEDPELVKDFVKRYNYHFPVLLDELGTGGKLYDVQAIPTTVIIDRRGNVIGGARGAMDWSSQAMVDGFKALLKKS